MMVDERDVHDVIGVGFGPANMALAVACEEAEETSGGRSVSRLFLEARPGHCWHPGMLLEDSLLQITALKDLIMVENPRSRFTFLNYLHEKGRLYHFLNLRDLFPTRIEFNDYLCWIAEQFEDHVRYGRRVTAIRPVSRDGSTVDLLEVEARDEATGEVECYLACNVVVATGGRPWVPDGVELRDGGRTFHAHRFLQTLETRFPDEQAPYRFVVVGSGQSGAELFYYLATRYPQADVTAAIRRFAYKPVDESDFTNEVFFPEMVDWVYDLPDDRREHVVDSFRDVNYAVVDLPLIRKIYRFLYDEKIKGRNRARVLKFLDLKEIVERDDAAVGRFHHRLTEEVVELEADGFVLATGYRWGRNHPLLEEVSPHFVDDGHGRPSIGRDYRLETDPGCRARVYVQGYAEDTHGISETVLSLLPVRAKNILESIFEGLGAEEERAMAGASAAR